MTTADRRTDDRAGYPPPALTAAVLALIAVVLAVWAATVIAETAGRAFTSYTAVEATVVDERVDERLVADRRGSRPAPFRVVTLELADGSRTDVRSDAFVVGAAVTVYRDDTGAVFAAPPARPGVLEWTLCAAVTGAAVLLAIASVRIVRQLRVLD